jgi:ectoine hydroxylase-related dioxygenase (phytanoyl-CoA dioxygenase family)
MLKTWYVLRNTRLETLARAIAAEIVAFVRGEFSQGFESIEEISPWLIEQDRQGNAGTSRRIRDFAKQADRLRALLQSSTAAEVAKLFLEAPAELHDVVRLRTVMRGLDYTHSRPHQDAALWPEDSRRQINMWLALSDAEPDCAPLLLSNADHCEVLRHRQNEYGQLEIAASEEALADLGPVPVRFGELIVFSPTMIHHAAPMRRDTVRWSIDFRFAACQSELAK